MEKIQDIFLHFGRIVSVKSDVFRQWFAFNYFLCIFVRKLGTRPGKGKISKTWHYLVVGKILSHPPYNSSAKPGIMYFTILVHLPNHWKCEPGIQERSVSLQNTPSVMGAAKLPFNARIQTAELFAKQGRKHGNHTIHQIDACSTRSSLFIQCWSAVDEKWHIGDMNANFKHAIS